MNELEYLNVETWFNDGEASTAFVALRGVNKATRNARSTTTYQVMSGRGVFHTQEGDFPVETGSELTIPAGMYYYDEGDLVMLAISTPPFRREDVQELNPENFLGTFSDHQL